jgi:hypothetical protein
MLPEIRDETRVERSGGPRPEVDVRHLFHGHAIQEGTSFEVESVSGTTSQKVRCEVKRALVNGADLELFQDQPDPSSLLALLMTGPKNPEINTAMVITEAGRLYDYRRTGASEGVSGERSGTSLPDIRKPGAVTGGPKNAPKTVVFLGSEGTDWGTLRQTWDGLVLTSEEDEVVAAMRLIEPDIERLAFTSESRNAVSLVMVRLAGAEQPVPLGSLGDGTRRMLTLAIYLARSEGCAFLVDEIDTGLHYTAMEAMWRMVIETALRLDVQVFATTHSDDCVKALAYLHNSYPDLAKEVSVHRLERGASSSVRYSAADLDVAAQHRIEVRG